MSKVIQFPASTLPSFEELDREIEAQQAADEIRESPLIDMQSLEGRAHAFNGGLSTLDISPVTGAEYWAVFDREPARTLYLGWARHALAMLQDIIAEAEKPS